MLRSRIELHAANNELARAVVPCDRVSSSEPDEIGSVSERVAAQYERYLYPPPLDDLASAEASARTETSDPKYYAAKLWPEGPPRKNLRILSAGCGTNQAAHLAYSNPDCSVLGIDLSEASLANERRLAERHGLKNLKLERRNLLDIAGTPERFDLIVCTGVLHHMEKPDEGLRALASVLATHGVLYAMVYANSRRAGVYFLQDMFRRLGLPTGTRRHQIRARGAEVAARASLSARLPAASRQHRRRRPGRYFPAPAGPRLFGRWRARSGRARGPDVPGLGRQRALRPRGACRSVVAAVGAARPCQSRGGMEHRRRLRADDRPAHVHGAASDTTDPPWRDQLRGQRLAQIQSRCAIPA